MKCKLRNSLCFFVFLFIGKLSYCQTSSQFVLSINPKVNYALGSDSYEKAYLSPIVPSFGWSLNLGFKKSLRSDFHVEYGLSYNNLQLKQEERQLVFGDPIRGAPPDSNGSEAVYNKSIHVKSIDFLVWLGKGKMVAPKLELDVSICLGTGYNVEFKDINHIKFTQTGYEEIYTRYPNDVFNKVNFYTGARCGVSWFFGNRISAFFAANYIQNLNNFYINKDPKVFLNSTGVFVGLAYNL